MRTRALLTASLLWASLAFAQEQAEEQPSGETEAKEVAPSAGKESAGKETAPGEVHTVVKGDTLWDLSQHYLGSPWYWPKVWSYNPEIANPHWIYPGNQVRFFPSGEEVPSRVEVGNAPNEAPPEGEEGVTPSEMVPEEEEAAAATGPGIQTTGKIGFTPPKAPRLVHQGFVTQKELEESGVIESSFSEAEMLSYPDTAYVRFKKGSAKVGDRFVIFRTAEKIAHPVAGGTVGYLTHLIGTMKIIRVSEKYATGQIQPDCWDEVDRGDMVGPFSDRLAESIARKPNERELSGYIVSAEIPYLTLLGEHHVVVVDKGSGDGVQPGNTFTIVRRQDPSISVDAFINPSRSIDKSLPEEDIGTCLAVDVKDKASMCMLIRTLRDLENGDRVVMHAGSAQAPTAQR